MKITRTMWWKLKGDVSQVFKNRVIAEGSRNEGEDADNMWKEMATHIRKVAIEVFEVNKENKCESKDTWWWNGDVQNAINEKKECYKRLHHNRSDENIQKYKETRRNAKKAVSEARGQAYTELYQKLDTKDGENDVYKMAKLRERKTRDFNQVKCIKHEADRLLVNDEEIKNRWREYFDKLFNDESEKIVIELDDSIDTNRRFVWRIQESELKEALKKMKTDKALGPDDIMIEVWRCFGDIAIVWLTKLFNTIFWVNKMPDEWRRSILVSIFKNKGDIQSCTNYRGFKLMSHTMKLWERVIEHCLRKLITVSKN
jgi:hypothetical protein